MQPQCWRKAALVSLADRATRSPFDLCQLALDNVLDIGPRALPELGDAEAKSALCNQVTPDILRPLEGRELRHHEDVPGGGLLAGADPGDHALEDQDLTIPRLYSVREAG
jgi:hypothetical protein